MAEEIIYNDQIDSGGDPDPLGLRRQLKQVKKPAQAADPLGLRSQMRTANIQQPAFQVQIAQPTFRSTQQASDLRSVKPNEPIIIKKEEVGYIPDDRTIEVEKLKGKATEAHKKIHNELLSNDDQHEKEIREYRRDSYTIDNLRSDYKAAGQILSPQDEKRALQREKQRRYDMPVTSSDIEDIKTGTILNEKNARSFIKKLNKADAIANSWVVDKFNEISNDPDALERIPKIKNVEKEIKAGRVIYDPETGQAFKPVGVIGSAIEAVKQKNQLYADRDFLKNTENDAAILSEYKARKKGQLDEPIPIPKGKVSEIVGGMAGTPWQIYAAGALGSLGGPQAGIAAATIVGGREMSKLEYPATFWRTMDEMISQGIPEFEAVHKARQQADQAAEVGAVTGAAMGLVGARMGAGALPKVNLSQGFRQAAFNVLKQNGYDIGKAGLEGLATGGVGVAGEIYKNKLAQSAGIKRDIDEGTKDVFEQNLLTTVALAGAIKLFKGVTPKNARQLMHGLSKLPDEQIGEMLSERVQAGDITQKAADETQQRINEYKEKDSQIPANITEEARFKIQDNIDKLNELEQEKETTHKSLQEPIKEKIQKLTEDNLALSKEVDKVEKPETGLTKKQEKEASEFAEELIIEGVLPDTYEAMIKGDPIGFWKHIAQQAQSVDDLWRPLKEPIDEGSVREQFGDTVVDYAKELFPVPETFVPESVSVIRPGEINRPETITIKPKENAIQERSAATPVVDETPGGGPQMGTGIPEPGEAAIPQEGQRPTQEESINPGQEGQVGEPRTIGITHRQMDVLAEELGLPTYEKSPERVAEWDQQAAKKLQEPSALDDLFIKLRKGDLPDHVETRMMVQYMGDIMAKIERNPYDRALQDQLLRTKDLFNIAGRLQGKGLAARKGQIPIEETLSDFIIRDREKNKAPLTEEQIDKTKFDYEKVRKTTDEYEQKIANLAAENAKLKAEKVVKEQVKKTTKQTKDYSSERKQIVSDIKDKLRKARGETSIVAIPYAKELVAIAPDVAKLMKSYLEQGIHDFPELVKRIHEVLVEDISDIKEKDVVDMLAGEYNVKKPTRSDLSQKAHDIKEQARLINRLEALERGEKPKNEKQRIARSREIESLRDKIKDFHNEVAEANNTEKKINKLEEELDRLKGRREREPQDKKKKEITKREQELKEQINEERIKWNEEKKKSPEERALQALKARYKKQIADIENKIANKDYGPDEKPEPITLDKEAIELKDKMIKAKAEREARLAQMEYEQMSKGKKALDLGNQSLDAIRTIQTNPDLSFFGRQGIKYFMTHPIQGPKLFWESVKQAFSQNRYDRWLYDIHNSEVWKLIEESGLAVLDPNTLHAAKREEQWRSQLIHKIPIAGQIAKASERAFTSAANMARVDWFMEGVNILEKQGKTWENSPEEYKGWASAVNNMTGRGGLGALEPAVGQLAIPFWSPRLIASNVNLFLNPIYYTKMPKTARIMLIKNMAQYVGTGIAFLALAKTMGADVEIDPRSSDFGKIKVGNTRYDVWGGASQYIRVLAQILKGQRKTGNEISELNTRSKVMTAGNLIRTKLSPIIGFALDAGVFHENVVGEKVEWKDAYKLMIPMLYNDISEAAKDDKGGPGTATISGLLSFLGIGAQTYGSKKDNESSSGRSIKRKSIHSNTSKKIKRI